MTKRKLLKSEICQFINKEVQNEDNKPSDIKEKLNLKFTIEVNYASSANLLYKAKLNQFGTASSDANKLRILCEEARKKFPSFFYKFKAPNNILKSLFFSTPSMRDQYKSYNNLLIIDTTFGTNRFNLPLMVGVIVNSMGRSNVAFRTRNRFSVSSRV